ncbi:MAG: alpha/beta hydrolase [Acidobacteria bacterium]|nr:alpha/beta hydrolase [Acidobacteriota bacterium]
MEKVVLGGAEQWISVRGETASRPKPVLLFVHGGPGAAMTPWLGRFGAGLRGRFTVVSWDQRGAGRSWRAIEPREQMTVARLVEDTVELARLMASRADSGKVLLVGHSFGAMLAILAASRDPGPLRALVPVAPVIAGLENDRISWERTMETARQRRVRRAVADLEESGPPPYAGNRLFERAFVLMAWAERFSSEETGASPFRSESLAALSESPEYDPEVRAKYWEAYQSSYEILQPQLSAIDLRREIRGLEVPVHLALGRHDRNTVPELAESWLHHLSAPRKELVWFERSGHAPLFEEPEKFEEFLWSAANGKGGGRRNRR